MSQEVTQIHFTIIVLLVSSAGQQINLIGLYRDVWIAAIASSRTSLATLTVVMCNTSQCKLRSLRVNSGMLNVICIVTYYTVITTVRVARLVLDCNGVFAIKAYSGESNHAFILQLHPFPSPAYTTLVHPLLEYSSSVWDHHTKTLVNKIQMVQTCAARFCHNDYKTIEKACVSEMIRKLNLEPLNIRRTNKRLTIFHKAINGHLALPIGHLQPVLHRTRQNRHYKKTTEIQISLFRLNLRPLTV